MRLSDAVEKGYGFAHKFVRWLAAWDVNLDCWRRRSQNGCTSGI